MYEVYVVHPILGEIFITMLISFDAISQVPDEVDGLPVRYRYVE